ncbi:Complement decay-accelerating factor, partial [Apaloderma vittatum]
CGPLPNMTHAEPPRDAEHQGSFSVGSQVTYRCRPGFVKRPSLSDTVQCLANSQWSNLPEFCGRKSCGIPANPEHGKVIANDHLFGGRAEVVCNRG